MNEKPIGYKIQNHFPCCANCKFGGYIDDKCICEIMGEPSDGDYNRIKTDPLGVCEAWKA